MVYVGGHIFVHMSQVIFLFIKKKIDCGIPVAILAGISLIFEPRSRQA